MAKVRGGKRRQMGVQNDSVRIVQISFVNSTSNSKDKDKDKISHRNYLVFILLFLLLGYELNNLAKCL